MSERSWGANVTTWLKVSYTQNSFRGPVFGKSVSGTGTPNTGFFHYLEITLANSSECQKKRLCKARGGMCSQEPCARNVQVSYIGWLSLPTRQRLLCHK